MILLHCPDFSSWRFRHNGGDDFASTLLLPLIYTAVVFTVLTNVKMRLRLMRRSNA